MAVSYDLATDVGKVRFLIPDTPDYETEVNADPVFSDAEISVALTLAGDNVYLAAAMAIESRATDEAFQLKVGRALDLSTDGAKLLDALMKRAAQLRKDAVSNPAGSTSSDVAFGFAQIARTPAQAIEIEEARELAGT